MLNKRNYIFYPIVQSIKKLFIFLVLIFEYNEMKMTKKKIRLQSTYLYRVRKIINSFFFFTKCMCYIDTVDFAL